MNGFLHVASSVIKPKTKEKHPNLFIFSRESFWEERIMWHGWNKKQNNNKQSSSLLCCMYFCRSQFRFQQKCDQHQILSFSLSFSQYKSSMVKHWKNHMAHGKKCFIWERWENLPSWQTFYDVRVFVKLGVHVMI